MRSSGLGWGVGFRINGWRYTVQGWWGLASGGEGRMVRSENSSPDTPQQLKPTAAAVATIPI